MLNTTISNNTMELSGAGLDVTINNGVATIAIPSATVSVNNQISSIYQPEMSNSWHDITTKINTDSEYANLSGEIWSFDSSQLGNNIILTPNEGLLTGKRPTKMRFRFCNANYNAAVGFQLRDSSNRIILTFLGGYAQELLCDTFPASYLETMYDGIVWPEGYDDIATIHTYVNDFVVWKSTKIELYW